VARWGDGWLPASPDPADLAAGKAEIYKLAKEYGRNPERIQIIHFANSDGTWNKKSKVAEAAKAGATSIVLWVQGQNVNELTDEINELAGELF